VQIELARRAGCSIVGIDQAGLTVEMVDAAHRAGMKVWVWTVNEAERARVLRMMGADGVITNEPKLMVETLRR
jgi:glycerophosphoryl diester phosphodiesterase